MGCFSNSDEGLSYEARFCDRCIFGGLDHPCAVMTAHMIAGRTKPEADILDMLIPRNGVENGQCAMFLDRPGQAPWDP